MDLTEAQDIKRCQEYRELYKKDHLEADNHDSEITHLEPDILECEVKWESPLFPLSQAQGHTSPEAT